MSVNGNGDGEGNGNGNGEPRSRLEAQINLILHGIRDVVEGLEGVVAWPPDWAERGEVDYLFRERNLLVRDADVDRPGAIVPSTPVEHDKNLRGLTRLEITDPGNPACRRPTNPVHRALGEGVVTPEHIFYLLRPAAPVRPRSRTRSHLAPSPTRACPRSRATATVCRWRFWTAAGCRTRPPQHSWLADVDGEPEDRIPGPPPRIPSLRGPRDLRGRAFCGPWHPGPMYG